jgi:hypothetical protein
MFILALYASYSVQGILLFKPCSCEFEGYTFFMIKFEVHRKLQ